MWNKLTILLCLVSGSAYARPEWVDKRPTEDNSYRYYVGRSGSQKDEKKSYEVATQDAYDSAIRENYGVKTRIEMQSFETSTETKIAKHMENSTDQVELNGFEQVDTYIDNDNGEIQLWALFRYKKTEIALEKSRMERSRAVNPNEFSEFGDRSDPRTGVLEIVTDPPGAEVRIDGERINFQKTPLRIYGHLPVGPHNLEIDHPLYEIHERVFVMMMGRKIEVNQRLQRAKGKLSIKSEPTGAQVFINGKVQGTTPLETIPLLAGEEHRVELTHPHADRSSQSVVLERNEGRELDLILPLKPAYAKIKEQEKEKEREVASIQEVVLYDPPMELKEPRTQMGLNIYYRTPTLKYFDQPNLVLGLSLHYRFTRVVGLEGELIYGISAKTDFSNGTVQQQNYGGRIGMAFYPFSEANFYLSPEYLVIENEFETKTGSLDFKGKKTRLAQSAYGLGLTFLSFTVSDKGKNAAGMGVRASAHQFSEGPLSYMVGMSIYNFGL